MFIMPKEDFCNRYTCVRTDNDFRNTLQYGAAKCMMQATKRQEQRYNVISLLLH
jgi:hypothetical protein